MVEELSKKTTIEGMIKIMNDDKFKDDIKDEFKDDIKDEFKDDIKDELSKLKHRYNNLRKKLKLKQNFENEKLEDFIEDIETTIDKAKIVDLVKSFIEIEESEIVQNFLLNIMEEINNEISNFEIKFDRMINELEVSDKYKNETLITRINELEEELIKLVKIFIKDKMKLKR